MNKGLKRGLLLLFWVFSYCISAFSQKMDLLRYPAGNSMSFLGQNDSFLVLYDGSAYSWMLINKKHPEDFRILRAELNMKYPQMSLIGNTLYIMKASTEELKDSQVVHCHYKIHAYDCRTGFELNAYKASYSIASSSSRTWNGIKVIDSIGFFLLLNGKVLEVLNQQLNNISFKGELPPDPRVSYFDRTGRFTTMDGYSFQKISNDSIQVYLLSEDKVRGDSVNAWHLLLKKKNKMQKLFFPEGYNVLSCDLDDLGSDYIIWGFCRQDTNTHKLLIFSAVLDKNLNIKVLPSFYKANQLPGYREQLAPYFVQLAKTSQLNGDDRQLSFQLKNHLICELKSRRIRTHHKILLDFDTMGNVRLISFHAQNDYKHSQARLHSFDSSKIIFIINDSYNNLTLRPDSESNDESPGRKLPILVLFVYDLEKGVFGPKQFLSIKGKDNIFWRANAWPVFRSADGSDCHLIPLTGSDEIYLIRIHY